MKTWKYFILLIVLILVVSDDKNKTQTDKDTEKAFKEFKKKHGKNFTITEEGEKLKNFKNNIDKSKKLQKNSNNTRAEYGMTKFSDLSEKQFSENFLNLKLADLQFIENLKKEENKTDQGNLRFLQSVPESYDWRTNGCVTQIKDQGSCGSCWAFSTIAVIESQYCIKYKKIEDFSEQNLLDCDNRSFGCNGGYLQSAFSYIKKNGIMRESNYTYTASKSTCKFKKSFAAVKVEAYGSVSTTNELQLRDLLFNKGPLSVVLNAEPLMYYVNGIIDLSSADCDPNKLNHAVNLVGYGKENGIDYWIVRNSWGLNWGENGYFRIARGKGTCGINKLNVYASIK